MTIHEQPAVGKQRKDYRLTKVAELQLSQRRPCEFACQIALLPTNNCSGVLPE